MSRVSPAKFQNGYVVFHADNCHGLRQAVAQGAIAMQALARGTYPGQRLRAGALPGLCSVGWWDAAKPQSWGLDWHRNEGIEICYLERGTAAFAVDDYTLPALRRGDLTITRPWQQHRLGNPNLSAGRLHWLILDVGVKRPNQAWVWPDWIIMNPQSLERLTQLLRHNESPVWRADSTIGPLFARIAGAVGRGPAPEQLTRLAIDVNELLLALMMLLERRSPAADPDLTSSRRTVALFLRSLEGRLNESWSLERMAAVCGLGRSRFALLCRQVSGRSPVEWLTSRRVEMARGLLTAHPARSITDIAVTCGFGSSQYFSTVFHRYTGCSPRSLRRRPEPRLGR